MSLLKSLKKKSFSWRSRSSRRDEVIENNNGTNTAGSRPAEVVNRDVIEQQPSMLQSSLWDQAYEEFRTKDSSKNAKLVDEYEALLKKHLFIGDIGTTDDLELTSSVLDSSQRRAQLHLMLSQGKSKHEAKGKILIGKHAINVRNYLASLAGIVEFAKDWITDAAKASPEASVAWSVVCLGLPLLFKPAQAESNNSDGLTYVTSRMQFYIALEDLLLPPQVAAATVNTQAQDALRSRLLELYQLILDFQIRSIVRFYKGHWYKDIYGENDWKSMHTAIKELETGIQQDSAMITSNDARIHLQKLLDSAESAQAALLSVQEQQLDAMREIGARVKEQVDTQHQILQQTNNERTIQGDRQRQEQEEKCLQLFRLEPFYETTKARIPRHVEGTCQWFLKQPVYMDWLSEPSKCLLVSADPGCGKSVLVRNLVDNELPKHGLDAQICYFFFKQGIQDSLNAAIPALLHQLLYNNDRCFQHVSLLYKKEGGHLVKNVEMMLRLLRDVLVELRSIRNIAIVLDALDECESIDRERLLTWIREFLDTPGSTGYGAKFLLTCRPYDEIVSLYEHNASTSHVHIPGNAESDAISQEVNLVIKYRAEQLYRRKRIKKAVQDELGKKLMAQGNRTYLWTIVVLDELERKIGNQTQKDVEKMLQSLPDTIYDAYEEILNRYADDDEIREKISRILNVMLAAARPLDIQEIQCAVKIHLSPRTEAHIDLDLEDEDDFAIKLRNWCGLFVQIHNNKATFLHQTARDFLLSRNTQTQIGFAAIKRWAGFTTLTQAHTVMTRICFAYSFLKDFNKPIGIEKLTKVYKDDAENNENNGHNNHRNEDNDNDNDNDNDADADADAHNGGGDDDDDSDDDNDDYFFESVEISASYLDIFKSSVVSTEIHSQYPFLVYTAVFWDQHFEYGICVSSDDLLRDALLLLDSDTELFENWTHITYQWSVMGPSPLLWIVAGMKSPSLLQSIIQRSGSDLQLLIGRYAFEIAINDGRRDNALVLAKYGVYNSDDGQKMISYYHLKLITHLGWIETTKALFEQGVDPSLTFYNGKTALHFSCRYGQPNITRFLLQRGANINAQDRRGSTALMFAAQHGHTESVRLLLEHDADPTIEDADYKTAWTCAVTNGHEDIGKLLPERVLSRRSSMSDLWPCKPFWDREMNGSGNSTYNTRERRLFEFSYKPSRRPSLVDLTSVALDDEFVDILKQRSTIKIEDSIGI